MNLLQLLHQYGQSVWLNGFERGWISRGELQCYIEEEGLTGVRSSFQSLQVAIERQEYDHDFSTLAQQGRSQEARSAYDYLIVRDLQLAADLLKQIHSQTQGRDGYVQIDLPPDALLQPEIAFTAAQTIWQSVGWSNLLVGIPATPLMLPVITQLISNRINVNATLVFSPNVYEQVFDSYLRGLKSLIRQGESVSDVVCFTSVSIGQLDAAINSLNANSETSFGIIARLLYQHYRNFCQSDRQRSLPVGAKPLRLVLDCTEIPSELAWRDLQTLMVSETVMMLPPSTLEMYREVFLLTTNLIDAKSAEQDLISETKILSDEQVEQLVNEEITGSLNAFHQLLDAIKHRRIR